MQEEVDRRLRALGLAEAERAAEDAGGGAAVPVAVETTRALSLWGLQTRIAAKVLVFNRSLTMNRLLGRDLFPIKSLYL